MPQGATAGSGIRLSSYPSQFLFRREEYGKDRQWSTHTTLDNLIYGTSQNVRTYTDLDRAGRGYVMAKANTSLSRDQDMTPFLEMLERDRPIEVEWDHVRYKLYGDPAERRAMVFGNTNESEYPGQGGTPIKLLLDVDWYQRHDVLAPILNKRCQVVITSELASLVDGGYEYEGLLVDEDETAFIDAELLTPGEYWIKIGSLSSSSGIGSRGSIQFGTGYSYLEFQIPLTTMSWEYSVEGEADRKWGSLEVLRCDLDEQGRPLFVDGQGNPTGNRTGAPQGKSGITSFLQARAMQQIKMEKQYWTLYGTKSEGGITDLTSGKPIVTGPGVFEFMEEGNVIPYDVDIQGIDFIEHQMRSLWFDRVSTGRRDVVLYTGEAGLELFSEWVNQKFGETAAVYHYDFVLNETTPFDQRENRKGFAYRRPQFTKYVLDTFGSITVVHWPILDNTVVNGATMPGTFYPISSYEFYAFDIGFGDSANMRMVERKDNAYNMLISGLWSPYGWVGENNPVYKSPGDVTLGDSYKHIMKETWGVIIEDVMCMIKFVPNLTYR